MHDTLCNDVTEQLVQVYLTNDYYERSLSELQIRRYYSKMVRHGRVSYEVKDNLLIGFIESWRLNYEQLGRCICFKNFSAIEEDVSEGNIAYIADIWVHPDYRGTDVCDRLVQSFAELNLDADYYVSERIKSKVKYVRVYDKVSGCKHLNLNKENKNGQ
jgi:ribosomal protein S18 acetylase RimI-like enzyme